MGVAEFIIIFMFGAITGSSTTNSALLGEINSRDINKAINLCVDHDGLVSVEKYKVQCRDSGYFKVVIGDANG